jgi:hypothetical protein
MAGWDALCIPTVLIALPDHALLRSGAMIVRKGEEPRMERLVMREGVDLTSVLVSLPTYVVLLYESSAACFSLTKKIARASGQTRCNLPSD